MNIYPIDQCSAEAQLQTGAKRLVGGSVRVFLGQIILLVSGVLSNFVVARLIRPEGKGVIFLVQTISAIGFTVFHAGFGPASAFFLGRRKFSVSRIASGTLLLSVLAGLLPMLVAALLWPWIRPAVVGKIQPLYFWFAVVTVAPLVFAFNSGFFCLGQNDVRGYNILRVTQPFCFAVFVLALLIARQPSVFAVAVAWLLSNIIPVFYGLQVFRASGGGLQAPGPGFVREAMQFGFHTQLGAVTQYLQHRVDVLLVAYYLPIRDVGLYSLSISIAELLWYVPHAIGPVLMPHIASATKEHATRVTPAFCRATLALCAVLALLLFGASSLLIPLLLPGFRGSIYLLWLLFPGAIFASLFKILSSDFSGRGRPVDSFPPAAIVLVAELAAGIYVVPRFGTPGVAALVSLAYMLNSAMFAYLYSRSTSVPLADLIFLRRRDFQAMKSSWADLRLARFLKT